MDNLDVEGTRERLVFAHPGIKSDLAGFCNTGDIELEDGKTPFSDWLKGLKDIRTRASIAVRIDRLKLRSHGDAKRLQNAAGASALRCDFGPGYRVYFADYGNTTVVLLCGGDKDNQRRDIERAKKYWNDFKKRQDG